MNNRILSLSLALLSLFSFANAAAAQGLPSPVGSYEVVKQNGDPIKPGAFTGVTILPLLPGFYYDVYFEIVNDKLTVLDAECAIYWANDEGTAYKFRTDRGGPEGNLGTMTKEEDGRWKSTMDDGGANAGSTVWLE